MADTGHWAKPVYQFGYFEAVQETGELYRRGQLVKIQELPFRVLITLLEQQGKIVSRDQLAKQLWPDKTFVEFDQGVSTAVTKLRQAIGDVAENPRFVETVPRRGYRFIAPVTIKIQATEAPESPAPAIPAVSSQAEPPTSPSSRSPELWMWAAATAVLLLAGLCAFILPTPFRAKTAFRENDRVILADFDNATGDELYDYTLNSALRVKLDESPFFSLISASTVQTAMEQLGRTSGRVSIKDAQQICQTVHAQAIVHGALSLAQAGAVQLRLEVDACGTGTKLAEEDVLSPSKDFLLNSLGESADRLRRKLGEPESSLQRFSTPLIQATTASFSALNAFASGEQKRSRGLDHETIADYKLATDLDPEFALAYARLGTIYLNESEPELSRAAYQKAFDLRAHTTERERLYLTAHYSTSGSGDLERGVEVYQLWRQLYPQDLVAPNNLADIYETLGQPDQARLMAQAAIRINPDNAFPYACLLQADQRLGRYEEAREVWREATDRKLNNSVTSRMAMFRVGVAQDDDALVRQQLEWAAGNPREGEFLSLMGWMKAASGHLREAQTYFHRAQAVAVNNGLKTFAAETGEDLAQFEEDFGDNDEARAEVQRSLKLDPSEPNVNAFGAMILANAGDSKQAEALIRSVQTAAPQDTLLIKLVLPMAKALKSLRNSHPAETVEQLKPVAIYDLSRMTELAPIFYRAQALLAEGRGEEAGKEFQRLLDLRAICPISPYLALAHLGIARSKHLIGDQDGARAEYAKFLDEWKDADSALPVLRQAKDEYKRLLDPQRTGGMEAKNAQKREKLN